MFLVTASKKTKREERSCFVNNCKCIGALHSISTFQRTSQKWIYGRFVSEERMPSSFCCVLPIQETEVPAAVYTRIHPFEPRMCINSRSNIWKISLIITYRLKGSKKNSITLTQKCNQSSSNYMLLLASQTLHRKAIKKKKRHWLQTRNLFPFLHGCEW